MDILIFVWWFVLWCYGYRVRTEGSNPLFQEKKGDLFHTSSVSLWGVHGPVGIPDSQVVNHSLLGLGSPLNGEEIV